IQANLLITSPSGIGYGDQFVDGNGISLLTTYNFNSGSATIQAVPEPGSMALLGMSLAGMAGAFWRRRNNKMKSSDSAESV
ncbi:MAG: PEP-CTERM sorting domain-containing protein, partial [Gemmataceae bacterium]